MLLQEITQPLASALPTLNKQYNYMHVIGSSSSLSNVNKFTINWSLPNNGLWDISYNTSNGSPNWYVSLIGKVTQTFASTSPAITISGSGISVFDGSHWVTMDGDNFVMVAKSGKILLDAEESLASVKLYPNPSPGNVSIELDNTAMVFVVKVCDLTGKVIYSKTGITEKVMHISGLRAGVYIVKINSNGSEYNKN